MSKWGKMVMGVNSISRNLPFTWNNSIELNKFTVDGGLAILVHERETLRGMGWGWGTAYTLGLWGQWVSLLWILSMKLTWLYIDWKWLYTHSKISMLLKITSMLINYESNKNKKAVVGGNLEKVKLRLGRVSVSSKEYHAYQILKEGGKWILYKIP